MITSAPVMPVPFLNHVLGVTSVPVGKYFLATLLGTLPSAFVAASVGALARSAGTHLGAEALKVDGAAVAAGRVASVGLGALAVRILSRERSAAGAGYEAARSDSGAAAGPGGAAAPGRGATAR